jgi:hypothetical protein
MLSFVQSYAVWLLLGLLVLLLVVRGSQGNASAMGCCGGGHAHDSDEQNRNGSRLAYQEQTIEPDGGAGKTHHSGGCC